MSVFRPWDPGPEEISEVVFTSATNVDIPPTCDRTGAALNFHPPLELRLLRRELEYNLQRGTLKMK